MLLDKASSFGEQAVTNELVAFPIKALGVLLWGREALPELVFHQEVKRMKKVSP